MTDTTLHPAARLRALMPFLIVSRHPALSAGVRLLDYLEGMDAAAVESNRPSIDAVLDYAARCVAVMGEG